MANNNLSQYYKSFSGTDSLAFIMLPGTKPILLGTATTLSYSIFRDKKPVPLIGRINVGGFTRGTRVVAGTMIFTLINQHWVNDLLTAVPWLKKLGRIKADELPIFDLMVMSANEYGASVEMMIYGIDITDEGQTLSVEDLFTENTFSFVARDIDTFASDDLNKGIHSGSQTVTKINNVNLMYNGKLNPDIFKSTRTGSDRNLGYNNADMLVGQDVSEIQGYLLSNGIKAPTTGVYDQQTEDAVKEFQSSKGLPITGVVDDGTYKAMTDSTGNTKITGIVISKSGALLYEQPSTASQILNKLNYKDTVNVNDIQGNWIQTDKGYVSSNNIFTAKNAQSLTSFPELRLNSTGPQVTMLQDALGVPPTGTYDVETVEAVKKFQAANNLPVDGVTNKDTWVALQEFAKNINPGSTYSNDSYNLNFDKPPGQYTDSNDNINPSNYGSTITDVARDMTVKVSSIVYYPDGESEQFSRIITIKAGERITDATADQIPDTFLYNPLHGSLPSYVEYIVYPTNGRPVKWMVNLK